MLGGCEFVLLQEVTIYIQRRKFTFLQTWQTTQFYASVALWKTKIKHSFLFNIQPCTRNNKYYIIVAICKRLLYCHLQINTLLKCN